MIFEQHVTEVGVGRWFGGVGIPFVERVAEHAVQLAKQSDVAGDEPSNIDDPFHQLIALVKSDGQGRLKPAPTKTSATKTGATRTGAPKTWARRRCGRCIRVSVVCWM